MGFTFQVFPK